MARKGGDGPNQSQFIREQFNMNGAATYKDILDSWNKNGFPGQISQTLYYQVKSKMGLSSRHRKKRGRKPGSLNAPTMISNEMRPVVAPNESYLDIERNLDRLVAKAEELRDSRLAEDLKAARRRVAVKLVS